MKTETLRAARAKAETAWNKQADRFNQWSNLGRDERLELVIAQLTKTKEVPCSFDTDDDGNCHLCFKHGGCAAFWANQAVDMP